MAIDFSQVKALYIQNEPYRQLEYVKLGSNNYFDMGSGPSSGHYFEFDVQLDTHPTDGTRYLFGYTNGYTYTEVGCSVCQVAILSGVHGRFAYGRKETESATIGHTSDVSGVNYYRRLIKAYVTSQDKARMEVYDTDGTLVSQRTSTNDVSDYPNTHATALFARYNGDTVEGYEDGYLYRFTVKSAEDGVIMENWVPAQRKSDGKLGIYDTVNNIFLQPHFTTNTTYYTYIEGGPVVNENPQWSPLVEVTQIKDANNVVLWPLAVTPVAVDLWEWDSSIQWTVGTGVQNADGFIYYPITASGGQKGVQIAIADNPDGIPSDGKFPSNAVRTWKVKFPEVGWYQMVMTCNYSSSGANQIWTSWKTIGIDGMTRSENRGSWIYTDPDYNVDVKVFKTSVEDEYHTVTYPDIGAQPSFTFSNLPNFQQGVMAQIVTCLLYCDDATVEHSITFADNGYRCVFDTASNIIFRKVPYDPSQYTPNS